MLVYEDEASFQQAGSLSRTWARKGKGCVVMSFPGRKSVKAFGAIAMARNPKWHFRFADKFNSHTFTDFLEQLVRHYRPRKIHLVADNAPYHKSPYVREWLAAHSEEIEIHYLPPYSPEFNATEYVWRKVRRMATHDRFFTGVKQLRAKLFRRFNRFQGNPASLRDTVAAFT